MNVAEFLRAETKILITTNIIGRGLNVHSVSLVINYDMPPTLVDYAHRLSHFGSLGKRSGVVISLVATEDDMRGIRQLEHSYDTIIEKLPERIEKHSYLGSL
uniref:Helicase C-terminal domain-containing protein n=1 Tax=Ditylenchus dipsaci TaxID=166011 RepID=A0A915DWD0_9BILA